MLKATIRSPSFLMYLVFYLKTMVHLLSPVFLMVIIFLGPIKTKTTIKIATMVGHRGSFPIQSVQNSIKLDNIAICPPQLEYTLLYHVYIIFAIIYYSFTILYYTFLYFSSISPPDY